MLKESESRRQKTILLLEQQLSESQATCVTQRKQIEVLEQQLADRGPDECVESEPVEVPGRSHSTTDDAHCPVRMPSVLE